MTTDRAAALADMGESTQNRGGADVVGVDSGFTGIGLAWCRSWCGG
jgi:hypothetical protein